MNRLKELRKEKGLTQKIFQKKLVSHCELSKIGKMVKVILNPKEPKNSPII